MKKLLILSALLICGAVNSFAQSYMVVNTETVFKAIPEYAAAVEEIDKLAQQYQKNIDEAYEKIEEMYNQYMYEKTSLSSAQQLSREETILNNEKKVLEYQESVFGTDGVIDKKTTEKLDPIQKKVMDTITKFAKDKGYTLVLDIATNPMVIYYSPEADKTNQIIALVTQKQ
mgnify:CR=1 FL=1